MNVKTNFYGAIGLASTIGKNGFAAGQKTSELGRDACHYISPITDWRIGEYHVLEKLGNACEKIRKFDEEAVTKFQGWETSNWQNYEKAKKEEELNEDWRKFNNQPTKLEKAYNLAKKVGDKVNELTNKLLAPVVKFGQKKWQQYSTKFFSFYFCSDQLSTRS